MVGRGCRASNAGNQFFSSRTLKASFPPFLTAWATGFWQRPKISPSHPSTRVTYFYFYIDPRPGGPLINHMPRFLSKNRFSSAAKLPTSPAVPAGSLAKKKKKGAWALGVSGFEIRLPTFGRDFWAF